VSELETMLRASCDLIDKDREIAALKAENEAKDRRIAALEGQLRRRTPRFTNHTPALLRPQAG
jgi:hypothetical protein